MQCWEQNRCSIYIYQTYLRSGPRLPSKDCSRPKGTVVRGNGALSNCSQGSIQRLYNLGPEPWVFGLPDTSAWWSSRSKQSTLPPNLLSLFNILYVEGRETPPASHYHLVSKGPPPSTPHIESLPVKLPLCSSITVLLLDQAATSKLASLPSSF